MGGPPAAPPGLLRSAFPLFRRTPASPRPPGQWGNEVSGPELRLSGGDAFSSGVSPGLFGMGCPRGALESAAGTVSADGDCQVSPHRDGRKIGAGGLAFKAGCRGSFLLTAYGFSVIGAAPRLTPCIPATCFRGYPAAGADATGGARGSSGVSLCSPMPRCSRPGEGRRGGGEGYGRRQR